MISNLQIEKQTCIPTVKWYQNNDYVIMHFEIYNGINSNIKINENQIEFQIYSNDTEYIMSFNFFENIDVEQSKYEVMDKCVKVVLKKTSNNKWTFLTNDKNIYKNNIKIDWNGWTDDSDDENSDQQFDFQKMMENMKGMEGMENLFANSNFQQPECEEDDENYEEDDDENYEEDDENYEENNLEENNNSEE